MSEASGISEPVKPTLQSSTPTREADARERHRSLTVVIPILNEGRSIANLEQRLTAALDATGRTWDVLFVDDGSTDDTLKELRRLNIRDPRYGAISLSRNFGKEIAVAAGLRHARGDGVVLMDGDLQHPPETIAAFITEWDKGYDVVYGRRRDRDTDTGLHRWSSVIFYNAFRLLSGTALPDGAGDFRLIDRRVVDTLNQLSERARFNKGLFAWVGYKSIGVPFDVEERLEGQSRWRWRRLMSFAIDGLVSFTTIPLRVWSYLGLLVSAVSIIYAVSFLVKTLIFGIDVPGFPTLVISVLLLSGVQLISLGVIGEYLGRVYEEVKGRPLFIVSERIGSDGALSRERPDTKATNELSADPRD